MKDIFKDKKRLVAFLLVVFLAIVPAVINFANKEIVAGNDFSYPLFSSWHNLTKTGLFSWVSSDLGNYEIRNFPVSIVLGYIGLFETIFSRSIAEMFFLMSLFLFSLFGFYLMVKKILTDLFPEKEQFCFYASLLAAALYVFNPFLLHQKFGNGYIFSLIVYAATPWLAYWLVKVYQQKIFSIWPILITIIATAGGNNPPYFLPIIFFWFIFWFFSFISKDKKLIKMALIYLLVSILSLAFYFLPLMVGSKGVLEDAAISKSSNVIYGADNLSDFWRFLGFWSFTAVHKGDPYYPYFSWYYKAGFYFLGYVFVAINIVGLFLLTKAKLMIRSKRIILWFYVGWIVFFFLAKGSSQPLGGINQWFHENVPLFFVFRQSYDKFGGLYFLFFSLTFASSVFLIFDFIKQSRWRFLTFIFILTAIIIYNFPFFSQKIFLGGAGVGLYKNLKTNQFYLPSYYFDLNQKLDQKKLDANSIGLPYHLTLNSNWVGYDFDYSGLDPIYDFIPRYLIITPYKGNNLSKNIFVMLLKKGLAQDDANINYDHLWAVMNVRNLVYRNDLDTRSYQSVPLTPKLAENLKSKTALNLGQLTLYQNQSADFLPHLYTANSIVKSNQSVENLAQIISAPDYNLENVILFDVQNQSKSQTYQQLSSQTQSLPTIEFKRVSPIKYRVIVHGAKGNFPLVFSETYHRDWKVYTQKVPSSSSGNNFTDQSENYQVLPGNEGDQASREELGKMIGRGVITTLGHDQPEKADFVSKEFHRSIQNNNLSQGRFFETWFKKPVVEEGDHFVANGYANSWLIGTKKICSDPTLCQKNPDGSYDLELIVEFWPQRLLIISIIISGVTLIFAIGYSVIIRLKRMKRNLSNQITSE